MNSESEFRASPGTARLTAVKVELEGYLREKIKLSRVRVLNS